MAEHVHFFTANGTGWSWRPHGLRAGMRYPSGLKMEVLDAGNVVLGPLLHLEEGSAVAASCEWSRRQWVRSGAEEGEGDLVNPTIDTTEGIHQCGIIPRQIPGFHSRHDLDHHDGIAQSDLESELLV